MFSLLFSSHTSQEARFSLSPRYVIRHVLVMSIERWWPEVSTVGYQQKSLTPTHSLVLKHLKLIAYDAAKTQRSKMQ